MRTNDLHRFVTTVLAEMNWTNTTFGIPGLLCARPVDVPSSERTKLAPNRILQRRMVMHHEHSSVDLWEEQWKEPQSDRKARVGCRDTKASRSSFGDDDVLERILIFVHDSDLHLPGRRHGPSPCPGLPVACSQGSHRPSSLHARAPHSLISTPPFRLRENHPK